MYQKHGKNELFLGIHYLYYTKTPPCEERRFVATNSWLVTVTRLGATATKGKTGHAEEEQQTRGQLRDAAVGRPVGGADSVHVLKIPRSVNAARQFECDN